MLEIFVYLTWYKQNTCLFQTQKLVDLFFLFLVF